MAEDKPAQEDVIAERRLSAVGDPTRIVTLTIGRPRPDPAGDWICPVHVDGIGDVAQQSGRGVDALQALLNAAEAARYVIDQSGLLLTWEGGEPGDAGLPRIVPTSLGLSFARQIEAHIDRKVQKVAQVAEDAGQREPKPGDGRP